MNQRSPIVSWLLLAATLSFDAVAVFWAYIAALHRAEELYFGLFCAQVSLLCIWSSFPTARRFWRWFSLLAFLLASVLLTTWLYERTWNYELVEMTVIYLSLWIAQSALLLGGIWFVQHTSFGQRWDRGAQSGRWQFSMKHILAVMTLTPIAIITLREAKIIHDIWIQFVLWTANNALLALAAVVIRSTRWHFMLRLATMAALASGLGIAMAVIPGGQRESVAINLIQAAVLFVWLELGELIPVRAAAKISVDGTSGAKRQPEKLA